MRFLLCAALISLVLGCESSTTLSPAGTATRIEVMRDSVALTFKITSCELTPDGAHKIEAGFGGPTFLYEEDSKNPVELSAGDLVRVRVKSLDLHEEELSVESLSIVTRDQLRWHM